MSQRKHSVPAFLVLTACLLAAASSTSAEVQCGAPLLSLDDVKALARETAAADRISRDRAIRFARAARSRALPAGEALAPWAEPDLASGALPVGGGEPPNEEVDRWLPGFGLPSLDETPFTAIEYRGELVVAGIIRMAGARPVRGIARWTADGWEPLAEGVNPAYALAVFGDRLIAAPWYGQVSAWDGNSWTLLPAAPITNINALEVRGGLLYAAGFTPDGLGGEWGRVATFDGARWTILGRDFDKPVDAIGFFRGMPVAGGSFRHNGSTECGYVAAWNGTGWTPMGTGIDAGTYAGVKGVEEYGGRLIVGGWFNGCGVVVTPGLAMWDGATWAPLPGAPASFVEDMLVANGKLYVAGGFAGEYSSVATWDGSVLRGTPDPLGESARGLARFGGEIAAVGGFTYAGACPNMKRMVGVAVTGPGGWHGLEHWDNDMHGLTHNWGAGEVQSAVVYRGDLVVAGYFQLAGDPPGWKDLRGFARWDGASWQSVGDGVCCMPQVLAVIGGDLIAAGGIVGTAAEGAVNGVARWDGAQWHAMGQGLQGLVFALAEYKNRIYAGGEFRIVATDQPATLAVWNGTEWSAVPGAPNAAEYNTPRVSALEVADGVLYVGGNFQGAADVRSPGVAAWDGEKWSAMGSGVRGEVRALEVYRGDLFAGGFMLDGWTYYEGLERWDGNSWQSMGLLSSGVQCLGTYRDKLLVGGFQGVDRFVPGALGLVAWDGQQWSGFGAFAGTPYTLCPFGSDLVVGGRLNRAGDQAAFGLARWGRGAPVPTTPDPPPPPAPHDPPAAAPAEMYVRSTVVTGVARLTYSLPADGRACVDVFDVRGARVATLMDREMPSGEGVLEWSAGSPPYPAAGVYFVRLTQNRRAATARIVFLR